MKWWINTVITELLWLLEIREYNKEIRSLSRNVSFDFLEKTVDNLFQEVTRSNETNRLAFQAYVSQIPPKVSVLAYERAEPFE